MALTSNLINIGNVVNDGLGDDLRTAFRKVNENFLELNNLGTVVGVNLAPQANNIFKRVYKDEQGSNVLEFKGILPSDTISVEETATWLKFHLSEAAASFKSITISDKVIFAKDHPDISILGVARYSGNDPSRPQDAPWIDLPDKDRTGTTPDIIVSSIGSSIELKNRFPVYDVLTGFDFGYLAGPRNIVDVLVNMANIDFGTVTNPGALNIDFGTLGS